MSGGGRWVANRRAVLLTVVASVLVAGVGGSVASAGSEVQVLRPKVGRRYRSVGLLLAAVPTHVRPRVSAAEAISAFAAKRSWPGATASRAELFIGSDGQFGPEDDDSVTFRNRLVWLLSWRDVEEEIHGPVNLTNADRDRIRRGLTFTGYGVVDATTANALMAFSEGRPFGSARQGPGPAR